MAPVRRRYTSAQHPISRDLGLYRASGRAVHRRTSLAPGADALLKWLKEGRSVSNHVSLPSLARLMEEPPAHPHTPTSLPPLRTLCSSPENTVCASAWEKQLCQLPSTSMAPTSDASMLSPTSSQSHFNLCSSSRSTAPSFSSSSRNGNSPSNSTTADTSTATNTSTSSSTSTSISTNTSTNLSTNTSNSNSNSKSNSNSTSTHSLQTVVSQPAPQSEDYHRVSQEQYHRQQQKTPPKQQAQLHAPLVINIAELETTKRAVIYRTARHTVSRARYATCADKRGSIPVYEYEVEGNVIMIDMENSYVHLTGICKAIGQMRVSTAEIVRLVEALPELSPHIRKVRGGFLKIQGTWVAFKLAYQLASRIAWKIRHDLVPIFGPRFPAQCLAPNDPGFGELTLTCNRRSKRGTAPQTSCFGPPAPVIWIDNQMAPESKIVPQNLNVGFNDSARSDWRSEETLHLAAASKPSPAYSTLVPVAERALQILQGRPHNHYRDDHHLPQRQSQSSSREMPLSVAISAPCPGSLQTPTISARSEGTEQEAASHHPAFATPVYLKPATMDHITPVVTSQPLTKVPEHKKFLLNPPSAQDYKCHQVRSLFPQHSQPQAAPSQGSEIVPSMRHDRRQQVCLTVLPLGDEGAALNRLNRL